MSFYDIDLEVVIRCLGRPIDDPELRKARFLQAFEVDRERGKGWRYGSIFDGPLHFVVEDHSTDGTPSDHDWVLDSLMIQGAYFQGDWPDEYVLPYGLRLGDSIERVTELLGRARRVWSEASVGKPKGPRESWREFRAGPHRLIVSFDAATGLQFVRLDLAPRRRRKTRRARR